MKNVIFALVMLAAVGEVARAAEPCIVVPLVLSTRNVPYQNYTVTGNAKASLINFPVNELFRGGGREVELGRIPIYEEGRDTRILSRLTVNFSLNVVRGDRPPESSVIRGQGIFAIPAGRCEEFRRIQNGIACFLYYDKQGRVVAELFNYQGSGSAAGESTSTAIQADPGSPLTESLATPLF